ncbi:MAG: glycosyl hydrolase [Opitutaceae bacterium]|nr:glycosyl hydrolase [Opitutaceae bacterium]
MFVLSLKMHASREHELTAKNAKSAEKPLLCCFAFLALAAAVVNPVYSATDPLEAGFRNPPGEARPHTYWLWMNGYMHAPSALEELRAMKDAGLGGVLLFEMGARGDKSAFPPPGPAFLSEPWLEQLKVATNEARTLGLQVDMSVISSWDLGGPWIEPRHATMALYATETTVDGGRDVDVALPFPTPERTAPLGPDGRPAFWTDVAVLAVRQPRRLPAHEFVLKLEPEGINAPSAVVLDQGRPNASAQLAGTMTPARGFSIAVSENGTRDADFREVLEGNLAAEPGRQRFALPAGVRARYVRLRLSSGHDEARPRWTLGEFEVHDAAGRNLAASHAVNADRDGALLVRAPMPLTYYDWKAGNIHNGSVTGAGGVFSPAGLPSFDIADAGELIDITDRVDRESRLRWKAPPGAWTILRYVCAITGEKLKVPSPASDGLASDHLNPEATRVHMNHVVAQLKKAFGDDLAKSGITNLYLASYEVVGKVWSPVFAAEFKRRRGYELTRYLPAIFGARIGGADTTERFLFDYQKTLGEVFVDAYYRTAAEVARAAGLKIKSEAGGPGPPIHTPPVDALLANGAIDNVQGEFWPFRPESDALNVIKEPASAAHIYGKPRVHLESFTSFQHWAEGPQDLKASADRVFCEGGNHFVWHTWTHQSPESGAPGWVYGAGTHLNRNVTWWPKAPAFLSYLARGSFLLQRGNFVADVLYYYGDGGASFVGPRRNPASLSPGYDYDVTNADVILNRLSVRDGRLALPDDTSYAVLVLPERDDIDPAVLARIEQLVSDGATVIGPRPVRAPGLQDFPASDARVKELAARLWGDLDGTARTSRSHGKGHVVQGKTERDVLAAMRIAPDFTAPVALDFTHRRDGDADIYFVRNREPAAFSGSATFRGGQRAPEFWDPRTGTIAPAGMFRRVDGGIEVPLTLAPHGSIFVIFRRRLPADSIAAVSPPARIEGSGDDAMLVAERPGTYVVSTGLGRRTEVRVAPLPGVQMIDSDWKVEFASPAGSPPPLTLQRVGPWTSQPAPELKYFAGSGKYRRTFVLPQGWRARAPRVEIDLGRLWSIGEVWINGSSLGVMWTPPFRVDCTAALRDGPNELVVEVIGTWHNRLVGEARGAVPRWTRTNIVQSQRKSWKDLEPVAAGLFGPIRLIPLAVQPVEP